MRDGILDHHGNCPNSLHASPTNAVRQVYTQGFGQGSAGLGGTAFQLVVIIFVELFGVSLGQLTASITPSVQVGILFDPFIMVVLTTFCSYPFNTFLFQWPFSHSVSSFRPGGAIIPYPNLGHSWKLWVYRLNPFTRLLSAMLSTEL
jgi:ATP-binding cassette, subfamily G (WHITE), member 2, SNQ2